MTDQASAPNNIPAEAPAGKAQIHVIPAQFYGAALKTRLQTSKKSEVSTVAGAPKNKSGVVPVLLSLVLLLILGAGGYFAYLNRDKLFGAPPSDDTSAVVIPETQPEDIPPPPPPPPPSAPSGLTATSTNSRSVTLSWSDASDNESAFRIERRPEDQTIYSRVTDLPPNSTTFQDNSVQASSTYYYRVIARNEQGESEASNEAMVQTSALPPPPPTIEPLPPAGLDTDSDGITDLEEMLFSTDARNPDTDSDGFLDGNEVFNLYNPNGRAPAKLMDSGYVRTISGNVGWQMTIPKDWNLTMDSPDGSQASIASTQGESFVITVEDYDNTQNIIDWYMAQYPDVDKAMILSYKSKGGYEGIIGADLLTTYIPWNGKIFIFTYQMNKQSFINFRTVYSMMLNSLELTGLTQAIVPAGTGQLPFEPAATVPGEITQPVSIMESGSSVSTDDIFNQQNQSENPSTETE
jgi:hypothetical protein